MKALLTSENIAKNKAALNILQQHYGDDIMLHSIKVPSGVAETPMSDEEGVEGALNRIKNAKEQAPGYDLYLGLEGIITPGPLASMYLCGWAAIETSGIVGLGCSAKVRLPEALNNFDPSKKLSDEIAQLFPEKAEQLPYIGTNGVVTEGLYTREDEFVDALTCAIGDLALRQPGAVRRVL